MKMKKLCKAITIITYSTDSDKMQQPHGIKSEKISEALKDEL